MFIKREEGGWQCVGSKKGRKLCYELELKELPGAYLLLCRVYSSIKYPPINIVSINLCYYLLLSLFFKIIYVIIYLVASIILSGMKMLYLVTFIIVSNCV